MPKSVEDAQRLLRFVEGNATLADKVWRKLREFKHIIKGNGGDVFTDEVTGIRLTYDELHRMEMIFEDALINADRNIYDGSGDSRTKYRMKYDNNGISYWHIESGKDIFKGLKTPKEYQDKAYEYLIENRDNKVVVKDKNGNDIEFIRLSADEFTRSDESNNYYSNSPDIFNQKMRMIPSLEDILLHSAVEWDAPDVKNHKLFKKHGFKNYRGRVRVDDVIFNTIVRVGKAEFGNVFYDINIEVDTLLPHTTSASGDVKKSTSINNRISQKNSVVNSSILKNSKNDTGNTLNRLRVDNEDESGYNDDIFRQLDIYEIPYRERTQLQDYIMQKNYRSDELLPFDCKEIGNNFYIWENYSKTEFGNIKAIKIDGNEDFIDYVREVIQDGTYRRTEIVDRVLEEYRDRRGNDNRDNAIAEETRAFGGNDRLFSGHKTTEAGYNIREGNRDNGTAKGNTDGVNKSNTLNRIAPNPDNGVTEYGRNILVDMERFVDAPGKGLHQKITNEQLTGVREAYELFDAGKLDEGEARLRAVGNEIALNSKIRDTSKYDAITDEFVKIFTKHYQNGRTNKIDRNKWSIF